MTELSKIIKKFLLSVIITVLITILISSVFIVNTNTDTMLFG